MGWTLEQVREMDADDFDALIDWVQKKGEDKDSMDMDAIIEAKRNKQKASEDA